jgi:kynureninase
MDLDDPTAHPSDATRADQLDASDDLAEFRGRFLMPDPSLIYFDGNSLGRLPLATVDRLRRVVEEEWGDRLIRSWEERWLDLPARMGDLIGTGLLGARPGETLVADSTTVNLYKLCVAALDARRGRTVVVANRDTFPTDRYVIEGIAGSRGGTIRWIDPDPVDGPRPADVEALLDGDVALVLLDHVHYRSAAIADLPAITAATHRVGALMLWDVCHSAGVVPIDLPVAGVDLAVGCSYKYLNGGPGAPSFLFVRSDLQDQIRQPIWGWWGRRDMFEMEQGYDPMGDIRANLSGTPPVLSLAAIEDGVRMLLEAGIDRIRAKSVALTGYAVELFDATLAPLGFSLASPRDEERRGSHVTVVREDARRLCVAMMDRGVVPDFRQPNGIRLGLAPLSTSFRDVTDGIAVLAEVAAMAGA